MKITSLLIGLGALIALPTILKLIQSVSGSVAEGAEATVDNAVDTFTHALNQGEKDEKARIEKIGTISGGGNVRLTSNDIKYRADSIYKAVNQSGTDEDLVYKMLSFSKKWVSNGYTRSKDKQLIELQNGLYGSLSNPIMGAYYSSQINSLPTVSVWQEYWDSSDTLTTNELRLIFKAFGIRQNKGVISSSYYNLVDFIDADDDDELSEFVTKLFHAAGVV